MPARQPIIYVIGGCNGAGKTTFAREFLPYEVKCLRFLNADEIARGLSPLDPAAGSMKAGRVLLNELHENIRKQETFAIESTLSGRTYVRIFQKAVLAGYEIELHYLWLANVRQAIARVRKRVQTGGHNVPVADIRRRFGRGRLHLMQDYLPLAHRWTIYDATPLPAKYVASSVTHDIIDLKALLCL